MKRAVVAALVLAVALVASGAPPADLGASSTGPLAPEHSVAWLSLGDSYGAGEGATRATGFCQQSPNAGGPKAATILRDERGWTIGPEIFAACTGYLAADLFAGRDQLASTHTAIYGSQLGPAPDDAVDPSVPNDVGLAGWAQQLDQRDGDAKFDVVVVSIGGNDIGFAGIVTACIDIVRAIARYGGLAAAPASPWLTFVGFVAAEVKDPEGCSVVRDELSDRVDHLMRSSGDPDRPPPLVLPDGSTGSLPDALRAIRDTLLADGGVVVVLGYPRLTTPPSDWGAWRHGRCNELDRDDAELLGTAAEDFDRRYRSEVAALGSDFVYVSRLDVFDDGGNYHSLCGRGVEWINTPLNFLREGTFRFERGFHPNDLGYLATAEAIAGIVEQRLGRWPTPPVANTNVVTVPPTVVSSEQHFDIGDDFAARCTVAWPTAPYRGSSTIQMRMSCGGVPSQFLFVDVTYGDPDLPVSPSRPTVDVTGTIVEIGRSEYGFTVLVVEADTAVVQ